MPRVIVSVTNDLTTDQRASKICDTFLKLNYEVLLVGRMLPNSIFLQRNYKTKRFKLLFNNGFLFYATYNIRLFFLLLFSKKDLLYANDLDTLLPNFIIHKLLGKKLIYDSHEIFTEVPELTHRPKIKKIWLTIEKYIFQKLKNVITVNHKIQEFYQKKYRVPVHVIRNLSPPLKNKKINPELLKKVKGDKKMIILQGTGINRDRGAEEAVLMMQYLENAVLYVIGGGDVFEDLKNLIKENNLSEKVFLKEKMPHAELLEYTKIADLGLSLDKKTNLNYEYSLPNKIFDYIQCETPILASNRVLVTKIISENNIGLVTTTHCSKELAKTAREILFNKSLYQTFQANIQKIQSKYTWENEEKKLEGIIKNCN